MRALQFICAVFLTWIVGIESASARVVRVWMMDEIANKAEVLLVGEIIEISAVEKIDANKTRWNTPLLRMAAKIGVLRTFNRNGAPAIQQEKQIVLVYEAADRERGGGSVDVSSLLVMFLHSHYVERLRRRRASDNQRGG